MPAVSLVAAASTASTARQRWWPGPAAARSGPGWRWPRPAAVGARRGSRRQGRRACPGQLGPRRCQPALGPAAPVRAGLEPVRSAFLSLRAVCFVARLRLLTSLVGGTHGRPRRRAGWRGSPRSGASSWWPRTGAASAAPSEHRNARARAPAARRRRRSIARSCARPGGRHWLVSPCSSCAVRMALGRRRWRRAERPRAMLRSGCCRA